MILPRQSKIDRFTRLQKILAALLTQQEFTFKEVRHNLSEESPRLISRLIHDLQADGHVRAVDDVTFSWTCAVESFPAQVWLENKVYTAQLPQTPAADRPRERLLTHGAGALRTAELLAAGHSGQILVSAECAQALVPNIAT